MPNSLEKAASKTMGTVKSAKASLNGLTGVFKHLMQEHGEVSALIQRVTMSSDTDVRRELYPTIRKALLGHEQGELNAVYPVLAEYPQTQQIAELHAREASELETAIRAVDAIDFGAESWAPAFEHLAQLVAAHVHEEESEFFPAAQDTIGEERARGPHWALRGSEEVVLRRHALGAPSVRALAEPPLRAWRGRPARTNPCAPTRCSKQSRRSELTSREPLVAAAR